MERNARRSLEDSISAEQPFEASASRWILNADNDADGDHDDLC